MSDYSHLIREHVDLSDFNTMGVSAKARYFARVLSVEDLREVLQFVHAEKIPVYVLGGGSNVLFIDDYEGLVLLNEIKGQEIQHETEDQVRLKIGAGENWHDLVMHCVSNNWGGIENLSLIPGSVGAAPIQNIGAYGVELEEVFVSLEAIEITTGKRKVFTKEACQFGYRESVFKRELKGRFVITSIVLELQKHPKVNTSYRALSDALMEKGIAKPTIKEVSDTVIEIRQSKLPDPSKIGNTGSFFKNPVITGKAFEALQKKYPQIPHYPAGEEVKVPAAWLIDECGWKGKRIGDAGVHTMQALVIVNYGNASGAEIWNLAQDIRKSVKEKFGVELAPEVNVVG